MSERKLLTNYPGDGEWIMLRVGGVFNEKTDHTVSVHRDGKMVGGVVFTGFLGSSIMLHMAGSEDNWATMDFLWMVFDYCFVQLGCRKAIGWVAEDNLRALIVDLKLGFTIWDKLPDMLPDGSGLWILTMHRSECKWLKVKPRRYKSNIARVD
jgi:hypothetical protein